MGQHVRAELGPAGRVELARLQLDEGATERAAAAALSVAPGPRGAGSSGDWQPPRASSRRAPGRWVAPADRGRVRVRRRLTWSGASVKRVSTGWGPRLLVA